jgi:hypothetical protein
MGAFFGSAYTAAFAWLRTITKIPLVAPDVTLAAGENWRHRLRIKFASNSVRRKDSPRYGQHAPMTL